MRESTLQNTFEAAVLTTQYPRTLISITVQEMQDSGGVSCKYFYHTIYAIKLSDSDDLNSQFFFYPFKLLACAINAGCLALMNSGLSMKFLVAAVHCMINADGEIILDPDEKQLKVK